MAVRMIRVIKHFNGLSTDDFPTDQAEGSTYHAIDTGEQWIFTNGMWELDLRMVWLLEMVS